LLERIDIECRCSGREIVLNDGIHTLRLKGGESSSVVIFAGEADALRLFLQQAADLAGRDVAFDRVAADQAGVAGGQPVGDAHLRAHRVVAAGMDLHREAVGLQVLDPVLAAAAFGRFPDLDQDLGLRLGQRGEGQGGQRGQHAAAGGLRIHEYVPVERRLRMDEQPFEARGAPEFRRLSMLHRLVWVQDKSYSRSGRC